MTAENEAVSQQRTNQSTWEAEDSFVLYFSFSFLFFFFFSLLRRLALAWDFDSFTGYEIVNCSEVLKLKFNVENHLRLLFEFNELQKKAGNHFFS